MRSKTNSPSRRLPRSKSLPARHYLEALEQRQLLSNVPVATGAPILHSNPTATAKLFLDFSGDVATTWCGVNVPATTAYDVDGDPTTFSAAELSQINEIWARVSEKFSMFNLDVTTVAPGNYADKVALKVVIGGQGLWHGYGSSGAGVLNAFSDPSQVNTIYCFSQNLSSYPPLVSEAIGQYAGRAFGLNDVSYNYYNDPTIYEPIPDFGNSLQAPIMGGSVTSRPVRGSWWQGYNEMYLANQNDIATIGGPTNGFGFRTDDHGNVATVATPLSVGGSSLTGSGIIEQPGDVDYFSFTTSGGSITMRADPAQYGPMLDPVLELRDSSGALLASADASYSTTAPYPGDVITMTLPAGNYTLAVHGHGWIPQVISDGRTIGDYADVGQYSLTVTLPVAGPTLPAQTTGLTATGGAGQVALSWNAVSGATSYNLYRSTVSGGETLFLGGLTSTSYTDSGLASSTGYYYTVAAVNSGGPGALSAEAAATTFVTAPAQVTGFSATGGSNKVTLNWTLTPNATGYNIYRSTSSGAEVLIKAGFTSNAFSDPTVIPVTLYYYKVCGVNSGGSGAMSSEASAIPILAVPAKPTGLAATAGVRQVALRWNAVTGAKSYNIYRSTTSGAETLIASGITTNAFTNTGLANGATYFYKVTAVNAAGQSALSSQVSGRTTALPGIVTGLTATRSGSITLKWTPVTGATSYVVYRSTAKGTETLYKSGVTLATFTDTSVSKNTIYYYRVCAVDAAGYGALSAEISI